MRLVLEMKWIGKLLLLLRDGRPEVVTGWNRLKILHPLLGFDVKVFNVLKLLEFLL